MYLAIPSFSQPHDVAMVMLFGGCAVMLASVLLHSRGWAAENSEHVARRALGHWLPIAAGVLIAFGLGHTDLAVSLLLGTSVAALSGVTGFLLIAGPVEQVPPCAQRVWLFAPVPVVLAFVLGIRGGLGLLDAGLLLAQGALLLFLWIELPATNAAISPAPTPKQPRRLAWRIAELGLCLCLGAVGAWIAIRGTEQLADVDRRYPFMATGATILSVVLAMPMVNTSWPLAASGRAWAPLTSQLGVVFLNLCVLLPAIIIISVARQYFPLISHTDFLRSAVVHWQAWNPLLYPRIAWRLDTVALLILTLMFVPAASGKLRLDWRIAPWLILGYCVYLLSILVANFWG